MSERLMLSRLQIDPLQAPLVRIVMALFGDDPWRLSQRIVSEIAERCHADVATLFQVMRGTDGDRLVLAGGPAKYEYELDWSVPAGDWEAMRNKGIAAAVAVWNEPLEINSLEECLLAVPLRYKAKGSQPKDVVAGVLKIERRREHECFSEAERAAFTIAANYLSQILTTSREIEEAVEDCVANTLLSAPAASRNGESLRIISACENADDVLYELGRELPEAVVWIKAAMRDVQTAVGYEPTGICRRFFTVVRKLPQTLRIEPPRKHGQPAISVLLHEAEAGFAKLGVSSEVVNAAVANLGRWLDGDDFRDYHPQLQWLIDSGKFGVLLDSFYRVLPFGTGGRRGPVGIGTNRFNPVTLKSSVHGHIKYLLERYPRRAARDLEVVIAYDVRAFNDLRRIYNPDLPNPLINITSRKFAELAAEVYVAYQLRVHILAEDSNTYVSTPELSYLIRRLRACGGLNISASHNHPDDNGGKFFGEHGGQEVPPNDQQMAEHAESADRNPWMPLPMARKEGLLRYIPAELHQEYIDLNLAQSLYPGARNARIVFTPLHGTGETTTGELLRQAGFTVDKVGDQSRPDGAFPTVPYRAPNPEVPESMTAAIQVARGTGADLVLACDPDADRIGAVSATGNGEYRFLNGNEIAAIVAHYKLEALQQLGRLPKHPLVIKTEVTTGLLHAVTEHFGGTLIGDLLVGFKYHANVLDQLEKTGRYQGFEGTLDDFVIAVEESHGVLVTPELRDKDAAGAAILLAELASRLRGAGRTLVDYLDDIFLRFGYYANYVTSMVMTGADGSANIQKIQTVLRGNPPASIGGLKVLETVDHQDPKGIHGPWVSETDGLARNVLAFRLEKDARIIVRPSGTEPKSKTYVEVRSAPLGPGAGKDVLQKVKLEVSELAMRIADDLTNQMLAVVGLKLPSYALRISGLVPLDKRIAFGGEFLPSLEERVTKLQQNQISKEEISKWIDESLWSYGEDARGLVADAIRAYLDIERRKVGADSKRLDLIGSFFFNA